MGTTIYKESINQLWESVIWTHKINRTYQEKLEYRHKILVILQIIASACSAIPTAILGFFNYPILTGVFAILTLASVVFGGIIEKVETTQNISKFKESSSNLWKLKQDIKMLCEEIESGNIDDNVVKVQVDKLVNLFDSYTKDLPTVPDKMVAIASFKLKDRKDEEADFAILK